MSRNRLLVIIPTLSLVLAGLIFSDWLPNLRGPAPGTSEWYWPYQIRPLARWWAPVLAAFGLLVVVAWWLRQHKPSNWRTIVSLTGLALGSLLLQLGLIYADRPAVTAELMDRTLSNLASGFFEPAVEIDDLGQVLRHYPQTMPTFASEHARTHPPGLIAANWLTVQALARAPGLSTAVAHRVWPLRCTDLWLLNRPSHVAAALAVWAVLPLLVAALTVFPAYALAHRWLRPPAARLATALVATMPALLLFAPKSVQLYPSLTFAILLSFHRGLAGRARRSAARRWFFLAGLLLSLSTFLSLGNGALLLLLGIYAWLYLWQGDGQPASQPRVSGSSPSLSGSGPADLGHGLLAFAAGAIAVWLVYWLGWSVSPLAVASTGLQQHYQLVTQHRRYAWWLFYNLVDVLVYAGLPLVVGFVGTALIAMRRTGRKSTRPAGALAVALAVLILLLDVSGSARGEVGRLWLFFLPLLALPGAAWWTGRLPGWRPAVTVAALQLALTLSLGLAWRPVRAVIVVAERPSLPASPTPQQSLDVPFTEPDRESSTLSLIGYDLNADEVQTGGTLAFTLYWQASRPAHRPYTVFTHLVDADGELVAQEDHWPVAGQWPPTCWRQGEIVADPYRMALPASLPSGHYSLLVGMYDDADGTRLHTADGRDAVHLTDLRIHQSAWHLNTR